MYYDGYEPNRATLERCKLVEGVRRAFVLENGTVVQIGNLLLEFEDNVFHEVEPESPDNIFNPVYNRTGRRFTPEQINEMTFE
ncbi:hypothetical protein MHH42_31140 [Bacillus sp. FSL L8-0099]|uniref:hypothetical protein n=1 Tax=unclassified Bacillus (in: firmicutes) TaxID=185979 RepID=UPI0030FBF17D